MKPITKEERRALMPECSKFIDDMRNEFEVIGISASENGQSVEWASCEIGRDWGECVEFPLTSKDMK